MILRDLRANRWFLVDLAKNHGGSSVGMRLRISYDDKQRQRQSVLGRVRFRRPAIYDDCLLRTFRNRNLVP